METIISEYKSGNSTYQIAAAHQIRRNTVRDILRRNGFNLGAGTGRILTTEQKEEIRCRRGSGEGPTALAKAYGVSLSTIRRTANTGPGNQQPRE